MRHSPGATRRGAMPLVTGDPTARAGADKLARRSAPRRGPPAGSGQTRRGSRSRTRRCAEAAAKTRRAGRRTTTRIMPVTKPPTCAQNATPGAPCACCKPLMSCIANHRPSKVQAGTLTTRKKITIQTKTCTLRAGIEQGIGAEHAGDGAACADHRHMRAGIGQALDQRRRDTARQVEDEIAEMPEPALDGVTEDPQEQHVADQVKPPAVQEHAGEDRRPGRNDVQIRRKPGRTEQHRRDHSVAVQNPVLVVAELPQKGADAHADQQLVDDRGAPGGMVVVERECKDHRPYLVSNSRNR